MHSLLFSKRTCPPLLPLHTCVLHLQVTVQGAAVSNSGWAIKEIDTADLSLPEATRIRGFVIEKGAEPEADAGDVSTTTGRFFSIKEGSLVVS